MIHTFNSLALSIKLLKRPKPSLLFAADDDATVFFELTEFDIVLSIITLITLL
jgi:hypothetical protein